MVRTVSVLLLGIFAAGCERKDVSCSVERLGMCHEWSQRTATERRELKDAVCHKSDEHFSESACPRGDVVGTCEIEAKRERTFWYRARMPVAVDPAAACGASGGTWRASP